ncbi:MAG: SH3 domain-containing protein [Planctomycetota bacterium]
MVPEARLSLAIVCACLAVPVGLLAQENPPQENVSQGSPAQETPPPEKPAVEASAAFAAYVARVKTAETPLRSGPDSRFPVLTNAVAGDLLVVVDEKASWCAVEVPRGYVAYVHRQYVDRIRHGEGVINANGVNIRPAPSSGAGELPIDTLQRGVRVVILGQSEQWLEVGAPPVAALWVPADALDRAGSVEEFAEEIRETRAEAERAWFEQIGPDPVEQARQERLETWRARLDRANEQLTQATADSGVDAATLGALASELETIAAEANAEPGGDRVGAEAALRASEARALEAQRRPPVEAFGERAQGTGSAPARAATRPEASGTAPEVPPKRPTFAPGPGSRFTAVGWVEVVATDREARVHLKKGGETVYRLVCLSNRYRLDDFKGKQIGVVGKVKPVTGAADLVDVERLEIIVP